MRPHRDLPSESRQIASLPLALVVLAPGHTIEAVNPAAEQFLGQSAARLRGKRLRDVVHFPDDLLLERISDSETPVSARAIELQVAEVRRSRIDMTVAPIVDAPGWQLLTLHDNSATEALGDDAGSPDPVSVRGPEILAHEIKNPLAGIRGAAQLLARMVNDKGKAMTGLITSEVDRIAMLIDQMQRLSRQTVSPVEPCNLHESVRRAVAVIDAAGKGGMPNVHIREEFDPSLPDVLGNPDGLVQVLINLISNAREACAGVRKPTITVRTRFASGLQLHSGLGGKPVRLPVEVRISDNGPGIPDEVRDHIFEPFVTSKKSGQGLGLALVRKLVRDMNGRITHERDEARGLTHFRVHLPLAHEHGRARLMQKETQP
jgi:two-component system nitrogen regulation sensor histidine kinase GlnL